MEIFKIVSLSLSGLLLFFVGIMRMSNPVKSYAKNSGIELGNDVNLLNEMRGVGAVMLCSGIIILLGTVVPVLTFTSFIVATLTFIGFAMGRTMSMISDGKPNKQISQGLIFELVFGTVNVICLLSVLA